MAISRLSIIKFLELALTCICIGIHYHSYDCSGDIHQSMLVTGTFIGYIIILIGLASGYLLQTPVNRRIDIFFSLVGCALFIAAGAMLINTYGNSRKSDWRDKQLAKASMAILNGVFFLIDCVFRFRGE